MLNVQFEYCIFNRGFKFYLSLVFVFQFNTLLAELQHKLHSAAMKRLFDNNNINDDNSLLDDLSELETDSFGSDSSVSDGLPMQLIYGTAKDVNINDIIIPRFVPIPRLVLVQYQDLFDTIPGLILVPYQYLF